jgi:kelch-like protein 10
LALKRLLTVSLAQELWTFVRKRAIRPVIYAVGGDDGHDDRHPYDGVMYLDTQLGRWHNVAPVKQKRSVCGVGTLNNRIYVVGGYNGERAVETVEEFDPATNTWRNVANISQRRSGRSALELSSGPPRRSQSQARR